MTYWTIYVSQSSLSPGSSLFCFVVKVTISLWQSRLIDCFTWC